MSLFREVRAVLVDALPSFTFPLTMDIMTEPVILQRTGQTYESGTTRQQMEDNFFPVGGSI